MSKTVIAVVTGVNKFGDMVRQTQGVKLVADDNGEIIAELNKDVVVYQQNIEKVAQAEAKRSAQEAKDNESRVSSLIKLETHLDSVKASYSDINASSAIKNENSLSILSKKYKEISDRIAELKNANGKLSLVDEAEINKAISDLKNLVDAYKHLETAGTKFRKKDIDAIKVDQFTGLDKLEEQLRNAGILTDGFKKGIEGLRTELSGISDSSGIRKFLDDLDSLKGTAGVLQEKMRGVNDSFAQLISSEKKIAAIKLEINGLDPEKNREEIVSLEKLLTDELEHKKILDAKIVSYGNIAQYAKQAGQAEQSRLKNEADLARMQAKLADLARETDENIARMPSRMSDLHTQMSQLVTPSENLVQNMSKLQDLIDEYNSYPKSGSDNNNTDSEKARVALWKKINSLVSQCKGEMSDLGRVQRRDLQDFKLTENLEKAKADLAAIGLRWSALFSDYKLKGTFDDLKNGLETINNQADLNKWTAYFSWFKSEVKAAGMNVRSFRDIIKDTFGKITQWAVATISLYRAIDLLKSAANVVIELDTAMIDLKKTTDETDATYKKFYQTANKTAKNLGVTTAEVISQTAEWSRLGYTMAEASKFAENSAIFAAISPELDTQEATDGLISIIKAFEDEGITAENVLDSVISKINKLGNEMAISNKDIVEVMTRSSSAMKAANNSFEETVALATAAVEITRDAAQAGNALKTLSMRIRGYDEETEEYSEDIAILTGKIADLTKVASNNNRGISLFEVGDPEEYRSTYDILKDIADIWDELTDKNRAQLLETLFGKQRAQVGAAILSNFKSAESAIKKMADANGNAMQEMEKVYDSLEYKLNKFQETWVGVAQNLLNDNLLKMVVDLATGLSSIVGSVTKTFGLLGTGGIALLSKELYNLMKSADRPKIEGYQIVSAYALVATRNELAA